MNEYFLHFIWQYQYFDKHALANSNGETLAVLHPGYHNTDQGPDFLHARLLMQDMEWHGNVEIHLKASDWYQHKHQSDKNYDTVLLHVVWENDCPIIRDDETVIPTLELKDRVDLTFLDKYRTFINSGIHLPCKYYLTKLPEIHVTAMFDKVLSERLERKGKEILELYNSLQNDWEETFWRVLAANFGFKINKEGFTQLGAAIPYKLLLRHSNNQMQLEALLFGQAGLLDKIRDDTYSIVLKKEYQFLAEKYSLHEKKMQGHVWKFLRTRPYNFPTIRVAQLAALLANCDQLINIIYEKEVVKEYCDFLKTPVSEYWKQHYKFSEKINGKVPGISETAVYAIIINVVIPFRAALYLAGRSERFPDDVFRLLGKLPAEVNKVSEEWKKIGAKMKTAHDSQAGIELYNQYCVKRKCLYCGIGTNILKH